jgi:hypothetical protein
VILTRSAESPKQHFDARIGPVDQEVFLFNPSMGYWQDLRPEGLFWHDSDILIFYFVVKDCWPSDVG